MLRTALRAMRPDAAGVPTDITEQVIRELALPTGLVDIKVCAVDETWSGLKLVIRRTRRAAPGTLPRARAAASRPGSRS